MIFLIKASLVVVLLLAFYKIVLERESFYNVNRIYLLLCIGLTYILPLIILPEVVQNQGVFEDILERTFPVVEESPVDQSYNQTAQSSQPLIAAHESPFTTTPHISVAISTEDQEATSATVEVEESSIIDSASSHGFLYYLFWIYIFGVLVLTIHLISQIISLYLKIARNPDQLEFEGVTIVNINKEIEPCSFFKYIFINPALYDLETYDQIIEHEKIHVQQRHTLDLFVAEIFIILLWFNPFTWILRKEVERNIEYQTDDLLLQQANDNKKVYQLNLVRIASHTSPLTITTNYNQSLIKQRILRMNAKKSNKFGYWKYAFCFPLVFLIALVLNKPTKLLSQVNNEAQQNGTFQDTIVDQSVVLLQAKEAIGQKDDKDLQQDQMSSKSPDSIKNLTSDMIENCVAFEEALAAGDIEKVRDILKTLDPECLKIAKGERTKLIEDQIANIKSKRKEDKKEQEQYLNSYNPKGNLCTNLIRAIDHQDASAFRRIMLKADDTCLNGEYGIPLSDIKLLKGLLNYDAILSFDNNRIVSTSQIGFIIDVTDADDSGCQDPAYLDLVAAIEVYNDEEIRRILSTEILSCPLSTDGFTNDFIVIREMMKYEPILENMNGKRLTVKGLGLNINFNNSSIYPNDSNNHKLRDQKSVSTTSSSVTSSKSTSINDTEESCLELIEAINKEDIPHALQILNNVDPNCFHSHTKTVTSVSGSVSTESISTPLIAAIRSGNLELSRQIIEAGGDVNYPHEKEESPLIAAVKTGKMDLIKFLVQSGAKLSRKDGNQMTALNYALQYENIAATEFLKSQ